MLIDYLGSPDNPYVRAVTRKTLCAAVKRVLQPGIKFDTMLVMNGPQGVGKSTLISKRGGEWFNDSLSLNDVKDKPAAVVYNDVPYSYVKNLQGDIVSIVDSNGSVVIQYKYDAWERIISKTGSLASTLGTLNPFRYRGYVYDEETDLYYLRSRYFASYTGRFICSDEICYLLCDTQNSNARNIFCYCCNNPTNLTDPDGNFSWKPWVFTGLALILIGVALLAAPYTGGTSLAAASATLTTAGNAAIATGTTLAGTAFVMEMSSQSNQFAEGSTYGKKSKTNRIDWEYNGNGTGNVHFHDANGEKIRLYSVSAEGIITKLEVSKAVLKFIAGNPEVQDAITKALEKILNLSGK